MSRLRDRLTPRRRPRRDRSASRLQARPRLEGLEDRVTPATVTWSGAVDGLWSRGANWEGGIAPESGDSLVFPAGASNLANLNDLAPGTTFPLINIDSDGYDLEGNGVTVGASIFVAFSTGTSRIGLDLNLSDSGGTLGVTGGTLNVTGVISGPGDINVGGATLILDGPALNTYTGSTEVFNGGRVVVANSNGFGSGYVVVAAGSELTLMGGITVANPVYIAGTGANGSGAIHNLQGDNQLTGPVALQQDGALVNVEDGSLTVGGFLDNGGVFGLTKTGPRDLILSGYTSASGAIEVDQGDLVITGSTAGGVNLAGGNLTGNGQVGGPVKQVSGGPSFVTPGLGATPGALQTQGYQVGAGVTTRFTLSGTNPGVDYSQVVATSGGISIDQSVLQLQLAAGYTPTQGDQFVLFDNQGGGLITGEFAGLTQGATFAIGRNLFQISYAGGDGNDLTFTSLGVLTTDTWTGQGATNLWSDPNNWAMGLAPEPGDDLVFPGGASRLTNQNDYAPGTGFHSISVAAAGYNLTGNPVALQHGVTTTYTSGTSTLGIDLGLTADQSFNVVSGGELDVTGSLSGGFALSKDGAGRLVVTGSNLYTNGTTVNDGVFEARSDLAVGTGLVTVQNTGQLALSGGIALSNAVSNAASGVGLVNLTGWNTINGPVDLHQSLNVNVAANTSLELAGQLTQSTASRILTKTGAGRLVLGQDNAYTGGTDLVAGTLVVNSPNATGTSGLIYVEAGATLLLETPTYNTPSASLYIGGGVSHGTVATDDGLDHVLNGKINLLGNADFNVLMGGSLRVNADVATSGTVTLGASSTGTLILSGTSSYVGKTFVLGGVLQVDGNFASSAEVDVLGGTLTGTGTVNNIVATGGTVAPGGPSGGTLTAAAVDLEAGSRFRGVLNGPTPGVGFGALSASGQVILNNPTLELAVNFAPTPGTPFRLVSNAGGGAVSGQFAGLPQGGGFTVGGLLYQVTYAGGDGNDVTLTPMIGTQTVVTSGTPTPVVGQAVGLTAVVTATSGEPTGTVTFLDNGVPIAGGTVALATVNGQQVATLVTAALGLGSHAITVDYNGTESFATSVGTLVPNPLFVSAAVTSTSVTSSSPTSTYGDSVTFQAVVSAVAPGAGTPAGSVAFYDGGVLLATATLNDLGVASFTTSALSASSPHAIVAVFTPAGGDYLGSDNATSPAEQTVNKATLTVQADPQTRVFGAPNPTLTYTVSGFVNGQDLGTSGVTGAPAVTTAATATSPASVVPYAITPTAGDLASGNYTFAFVDGSLTVTPASTTTTLVAPVTSVSGQPVSMTVTVSPIAPGSGTVDGVVAFYDGPTLIAIQSLNNGATTFEFTPALGPHLLSASFGVSGNFLSSVSTPSLLTVTPASTAVTTQVTSGPVVAGQPLTVHATVATTPPGSGTPTGVVTLSDGSTLLASADLDGNGAADFTVTFATPGVRNLTVAYAGDATHLGSSSPVSASVGQASTTTLLTAQPGTAVVGQVVTLTATVATVAPGTGTPTGTVQFLDGGNVIGSANLINGVAVLATTLGSTGVHSLTASFAGGSVFVGSTAPAATVSVSLAAARVALGITPAVTVTGQPMDLVAFVSAAAPSLATPTGVVRFYRNGVALGDGVVASGRATLRIAAALAGQPQTYTAVYLGDGRFAGLVSNPAVETVTAAGTATRLAAVPVSSAPGRVQLVATVSPLPLGGGVPSGQVVFTFANRRTRTVALVNGTASLVVQAGQVLSQNVRVTFVGNSNYLGSTTVLRVARTVARSIHAAAAALKASLFGPAAPRA